MIGGLAAAAAYVLINGVLAAKAHAMGLGVALNLSNEVIMVTGVRLAWLPTVAMAFLGALVALSLLGAKRVLPVAKTRTIFLLSFAGMVLCLVVCSYVLESSVMTVPPSETDTGVGLAPGVRGWVQAGGQAAVVQLAGLVAVASLVRRKSPRLEDRRGNHPAAEEVRERP